MATDEGLKLYELQMLYGVSFNAWLDRIRGRNSAGQGLIDNMAWRSRQRDEAKDYMQMSDIAIRRLLKIIALREKQFVDIRTQGTLHLQNQNERIKLMEIQTRNAQEESTLAAQSLSDMEREYDELQEAHELEGRKHAELAAAYEATKVRQQTTIEQLNKQLTVNSQHTGAEQEHLRAKLKEYEDFEARETRNIDNLANKVEGFPRSEAKLKYLLKLAVTLKRKYVAERTQKESLLNQSDMGKELRRTRTAAAKTTADLKQAERRIKTQTAELTASEDTTATLHRELQEEQARTQELQQRLTELEETQPATGGPAPRTANPGGDGDDDGDSEGSSSDTGDSRSDSDDSDEDSDDDADDDDDDRPDEEEPQPHAETDPSVATFLPFGDIQLLTQAGLPSTADSKRALKQRKHLYKMGGRTERLERARAIYAAADDANANNANREELRMKAFASIIQTLESCEPQMVSYLLREPHYATDTIAYNALHTRRGNTRITAWDKYTQFVAFELHEVYQDFLGVSSGDIYVPPLKRVDNLLQRLGFQGIQSMQTPLKQLFTDAPLDTGDAEVPCYFDLVTNYEETLAPLIRVQCYLNRLRDPAGQGSTRRRYTDPYSVQDVTMNITLPQAWNQSLADYTLDDGNTRASFETFLGWLKTQATDHDELNRRRSRQQSNGAGGGNHLQRRVTAAAIQQKANNNDSVQNGHHHGPLTRGGDGNQWQYNHKTIPQQDQVAMVKGKPLWTDGNGRPQKCSKTDRNGRKCSGYHKPSHCPLRPAETRRGKRNRGKRGKRNGDNGEAADEAPFCRDFNKPEGCPRGKSCRFRHSNRPGKRKRDQRDQGKRGRQKTDQQITAMLSAIKKMDGKVNGLVKKQKKLEKGKDRKKKDRDDESGNASD